MRWLVGLLFIAHGLIHLGVWIPPYKAGAPFNPGSSWLLRTLGTPPGTMRVIAIALAVVMTVGFVLAGVGWLVAQGWARSLAIWSAVASLALLALYFHPWLSAAVLIDVAIIYLLRRS